MIKGKKIPSQVNRLVAAGIVAAVITISSASVYTDNAKHRKILGRDVAIWKPMGQEPKNGFPVIVFSHGYSGCNTQSAFLNEALAEAGYLVLAPNHQDAGCGAASNISPSGLLRRQQAPFHDAHQWNEGSYIHRREDITAVLDAVLREKTFEGVHVDASRVGVSGHSLGGYTALGMAGGWPSWKDPRIKAVLALSPYCAPYVAKRTLANLKVPVMYQGGTEDYGTTNVVKHQNGAYAQSSVPKYFVELNDAGHYAWTNRDKKARPHIKRYSVAFFDRYLKGQNDPDPLAPLIQGMNQEGIYTIRGESE
jgi:predicted dienelactone hydrolase